MGSQVVQRRGVRRLSVETQRLFDGFLERRGRQPLAKAMGITPSQVDRLAFGGAGSPALVEKVEEIVKAGGLAA